MKGRISNHYNLFEISLRIVNDVPFDTAELRVYIFSLLCVLYHGVKAGYSQDLR